MRLALLGLAPLVSFVHAQAPSTTSNHATLASTTTMAANISAAEYTITALPAVTSQPSCIFNCLIPIGLADPSNCDDVTNQCACLNAPADAMNVLTSCIATVCTETASTSAYAAVATGLYQSYCQSLFGTTQFSQAISANVAADAAASSTSADSSNVVASATTSTVGATGSASAGAASGSGTAKSLSVSWKASLFTTVTGAVGALVVISVL